MEKRRLRMLKIYPLPINWVEIADPMTNRFIIYNLLLDKLFCIYAAKTIIHLILFYK